MPPTTSTRQFARLVGALLWALLVLGIYFWIHKAITPPLVQALGGAMWDTATAFLLVAVGGGLGRSLFRRLILTWQESLSRPERLSAEALTGLGLLSVAMFGVGLVNLSAISMGILILACIGLTGRDFGGWAIDLWAWVRGMQFSIPWAKGLALFIGLNLLMAWMMAATPPTTFDSLTYQLVGPKHAVAAGRFEALPESHFFAFPQALNTLFAGQMALLDGRLTGGAILHGMVGVLWLMAIGGYGSRRFSPFVGQLAPAILLSASSIWLQMTWAYVDLWTGLCGMLAWIGLEEWRSATSQRDKTRWLVAVGIFVGLAMSAKYNTLVLGLLIGLYLVWVSYQQKASLATLGQSIIIYGLTASLVLLPYLLRNMAFYENPVYPFGPATGQWDSLLNDWYTGADRTPLQTEPALTIPILISPTFLGVEGGLLWSATIGPLFLLLIPLLGMVWSFFESNWRQSIIALLGMVGLYHIAWLGMTALSIYGGQTRFVYPMFGWLAILAAVALQGFTAYPTKPLNLNWMLRTLVALVLGLTLVNHIANTRPKEGDEGLQGTTTNSHFAQTRTLEYWTGVLDDQQFLEDQLGWHIVAMNQVNNLPAGSQVQFLWETRSLYCNEPHITCHEDSILAQWWHDRHTIGDGSAEAILADWQGRGITHLLIWEDGREFEFKDNPHLTDADQQALNNFLGLMTVVWNEDASYTLYTMPAPIPD